MERWALKLSKAHIGLTGTTSILFYVGPHMTTWRIVKKKKKRSRVMGRTCYRVLRMK